MTLPELLIQLIGLAGTGLFFLSYQFRSNQTLFRIQLAAYGCYALHFFLLGAYTGSVSYLLNALRSFCLGSRVSFLQTKKMCAGICILQLLTLGFTWTGWLCVLPVAANVAATVAGYTRNGRKIRAVAMFVNSPLWLVYNIGAGSLAGIIDEVMTEASLAVSVLRFGWKNLDRRD